MSGLTLMYDDRRRSFLHRADPISKLVFVVSTVVLAVTFQRATWNLVLLVLVATTVTVLSGTSLWTYLVNMRLLAYLAAAFAIGIPLFGRLPGNVVFETPFKSVTDAGIAEGLVVGFRLLIIGVSSLAFVRTTHPSDIVQAMTRLGVDYKYAHTLALAIVFLPLLITEIDDIRRAQRVRRLGANRPPFIGAAERQLHLMFASLVRGVRRAQALAVSMTAKGFGRDRQRSFARPYEPFPPGRWLGAAGALALPLGIAASLLTRA
jgi:energy-coupling factor transport system permease protein